MNTPDPQPKSALAPATPISLASKIAFGGGPLAIAVVWALTQFGHVTMSPVEAAAIGGIGASAIGYVIHVGGAVVNALLNKVGVTPPAA